MNAYQEFLNTLSTVAGKVIDRCKDNGIPVTVTISYAVATYGANHAARITFSYRDNNAKRPIPITLHSQIVNETKFHSIKQLVNGMYGCVNAGWNRAKMEGMVK